jgi:rhodanese-related sulfurtransferase
MLGSLISRLTGGGAAGSDVDSAGLAAALKAGAHALVDVREPHEFAAGHIPGAVNLPLSRFNPAELPQGRPVILTCQAGGRSARACAAARQAGRDDVINHQGGFGAWAASGGAIER